MMFERIKEKLEILADAAKYDVSCSSSGSKRSNKNKGLEIQMGWEFAIPTPRTGAAYHY